MSADGPNRCCLAEWRVVRAPLITTIESAAVRHTRGETIFIRGNEAVNLKAGAGTRTSDMTWVAAKHSNPRAEF